MAKEKEVKFEDKIKELETIINELESGEIDLDLSIEKYTRAMKLVGECDERLKNIEEQVNKIVNENGSLDNYEAKDE
jgi:exodeoxyribonuclease VII, small subunit